MRADRLGPQSTRLPRPSASARDQAGGPSGDASSATSSAAEPKEWTVLGFFNGNNDLEPFVTSGIQQSEGVGPNANLNVAIQLARAPQSMVYGKSKERDGIDGDWAGVRRYEVRFTGETDGSKIQSKVTEKLPSFTDMGSPGTLADFLKWGIKNYPAKHYMVVFNNHGAGFRGISFDDVHQSHIDPTEMREVLEHVKSETGVKPDVLLFDACEMAQTEVAYELRNSAKFLVGGENLIGAPGMPYAEILARPAFDENVSGRDLARHIVDAAAVDEADRVDNGLDEAAGQFSAIDLSKMNTLRKACDTLSQTLRQGGVSRAHLVEIVKRTKKFDGRTRPDKDFRDLGDFANNVLHSRHVKSDAIRAAAQGVLDALDKAVIANETEGEGMSKAHGLSVYLPTDGGRNPKRPRQHDPYRYEMLDMTKDGEWGALIAHMGPRR
ncbi:MAG: hypothetical protein EB084_23995 [Proteobacteria bacterium]|nr:hypothetical protein [Pseudomonadota bacterium]